MNPEPLTLYAANTANGQKATVVLEELELAYGVVSIDLMAGEHLGEGYTAINPVGRIPTLIDRRGDEANTVYGTLAIGLHLASGTSLFPNEPAARAKMFEAVALISTDLAPALSGQFMFSIILPDKPRSAIEYFSGESHRYLAQLERWASDATYLAGDDFTLADALAYPNVAVSAERIAPGLDDYPALRAWRDRIAKRPGVQRGMAALA